MGRRRKSTSFSYADIVSSAYIRPSEYEEAQKRWSSDLERPKGVYLGRKGKTVEPLPPLPDDADDLLDDLS
jgi:hypothetical protein